MALRVSLFVVAALLLGAHFLREGSLAMVALCVCTPFLFLVRRRWALLVLQFFAYAAAIGWLAFAVRLVELRMQLGRAWTLAAIILGAVALFTALSGALLNSRIMKERYPF